MASPYQLDPDGRRSRPAFLPATCLAILGLAAGSSWFGERHDPTVDAVAREPGVPGRGAGAQEPAAGDESVSVKDDAYAGVVVDREGIALRKPILAQRWTSAEPHLGIEPGAWIRTGTRGANALLLELSSGAELLLGPATQVEVVDATRLRLFHGEIELIPRKGAPVTVVGPADVSVEATGRRILRSSSGELRTLPKDPRWLRSYRTNASTEAMGSLLAKVDGRNVPLTIGYHKVTVDIRDQIARTVVEQSFRNHTSTVLEGVFYFPLPADASISSFGMWIAGEFVEGEIVEKQRAREIYETILRERRDPGLLEWSGGNLFKARVFPIHGEKRIKLSYTQILPKRDGRYRYRYGLRSELLQQNPLEKLQIEVNVHSSEALAGVSSPSHDARIRTTGHAASVELFAEEYTPEADFELAIDTAGDEPVRLVSHRRGEDGYFLVLFDAPTDASGIGAVSDDPVELLLMADTSGSLYGPARREQLAFLEALLGSLGPNDRFNLLTCDVVTRWAFSSSMPATLENQEQALRFVEEREPLGWTDLDRAFEEAARRAAADTQVVYVGDGISTTGDADPAAFAQRLERSYQGNGSFHAVVPGSSYERLALRGVAALGSGSLRTMGGSLDPARTARELLEEITRPSVRDLAITVNGIATAAIYPTDLSNLPLGSQQLVVGRYDPRRGATEASVVVRGSIGEERIEHRVTVPLSAEGEGNSFLPRFWARHHLDFLLEQGATQELQGQIVALSEDFQIITPYTSFLVLESDEDRERFQVRKRFRMRDGEEFFAEGRDHARYELLREQMLLAKRWRMGLRAEVLARLAGMGRELTEALAQGGYPPGLAGGYAWHDSTGDLRRSRAYARSAPARDGSLEMDLGSEAEFRADRLAANEPALEELGYVNGEGEDLRENTFDEEDFAFESEEEPYLGPSDTILPSEQSVRKLADTPMAPRSRSLRQERAAGRASAARGGRFGQSDVRSFWPGYDPFEALLPAFSTLRGPDPPWTWPQEVQEIVATLDRRRWMSDNGARIQFETATSSVDSRGRTWEGARALLQVGPEEWLSITGILPGADFRVESLQGGRRAVYTGSWGLGRSRDSQEADATSWPSPFAWYFGDRVRALHGYTARRSDLSDETTVLEFRDPSRPEQVQAVVVDRNLGAVLEVRWEVAGQVRSLQRFEGHKRVANAWWPTRIVSGAPNAVERSLTTVDVSTKVMLPPAVVAAVTSAGDPFLFGTAPTDLAAVKQAAAEGRATLEDSWFLLRHHAARERWDSAEPHLHAVLEHARTHLAHTVVELAWLQLRRRHEELKTAILDSARSLVAEGRQAEYAVAQQLIGYAATLNAGNERLAILEALRPLYERQPDAHRAMWSFAQARIAALQQMGRSEQVFRLYQQLVAEHPTQTSAHLQYAQLLAQRGDFDRALEGLAEAQQAHGPWSAWEVQQFRQSVASILWDSYRLETFVEVVEGWWEEDPASSDQSLFDRYLSALVMLDREAKATEVLQSWLQLSEKEALASHEQGQLRAAIQHCLGNGHQMYRSELDPLQVTWLADAFPRIADHSTLHSYAQWIITHWQFRRTQEGRDLAVWLYGRVVAEADDMPAERLQRFVQWLHAVDYLPEEGSPAWERIHRRMLVRWSASEDKTERGALAMVLLTYADLDTRLAVRRRTFQEADDVVARRQAANALFAALLESPWTEARREELLFLLPSIGAPSVAVSAPDGEATLNEADRNARILGIHRWTDWMVAGRTEALLAELPNRNELPRRTLELEAGKARRQARTETAARLARSSRGQEDELLRSWLRLEEQFLSVQLRKDVDGVFEDILSELALQLGRDGYAADPGLARQILAARRAATLSHLLTLLSEEGREARTAQVRTLFDAGLETGSALLDWQGELHDLLLAMDRPSELAERLVDWFGDGSDYARMRWGRAHAYLEAELSRLEAAAAIFEKLAAHDELDHGDYRSLADWYTALDRPAEAESARLRSWKVLGEYALSQRLQRDHDLYARSGSDIPPELDPEVALRVVALLNRASHPANHLWQVRGLYASTKDFRLLEGLPEAVIGRSSQEIYPFLSQLLGITDMIQDEATLDRLETHLAELAASPENAADRRALVLLRYAVARRAAEQGHGATPHIQRCLAALREAYTGEWADGEPWLYAQFHRDHLATTPQQLVREQLDQLRRLTALPELEPEDRFRITDVFAEATWRAGERQQAVAILEAGIREFRAWHEDRSVEGAAIPPIADPMLRRMSGYLCALGRFRAAEDLWEQELRADHPTTRRLAMRRELFQVYRLALDGSGELSFGAGLALYQAAQSRAIQELTRRSNERHATQIVQELSSLWQIARRRVREAEPGRDATRFAFEKLPGVLDLYQYRNGQEMVRILEQCLREIASNRTALEFLVVRAENEPHWLRLQGQDFWARHAWTFAHLRDDTPRMPAALEDRVLGIVMKELRRDLRGGQARSRMVYHSHNGEYWKEKEPDFLAAALAILDEVRDSEVLVLHVADYLYHGVQRPGLAIEALQESHRRELLGVPGRDVLARYLQWQKRWGESVPVLEGLVQDRPDTMDYRARLLRGYSGSQATDRLESARAAAESWFRERSLWTEGNIATLAEGCVDTELDEAGARHYAEAIALHTKTAPNRGVGDGILSRYYRNQSLAFVRLGRTADAVDAAAGAIVSWGHHISDREADLVRLREILARARDFEAYVRDFEAEVRSSGLENPILRKALAQVHLDREEYDEAAQHLLSAVETTPHDLTLHRLLIQALDEGGQPERAREQTLALARTAGHDLGLWRELGWRVAREAEPAEAERAFTQLVEVFPHESEGHQALAEVRQRQDRWEEAAAEWRQVIRIRTQEPTGYLGVARCLLELEEWQEAARVLQQILQTEWPGHFGDVHRTAGDLLHQAQRHS